MCPVDMSVQALRYAQGHCVICSVSAATYAHVYTCTLCSVRKASVINGLVPQPSVITVCSGNMMHKWCVELPEEEGGAPQLVLDRSYKFQGGL